MTFKKYQDHLWHLWPHRMGSWWEKYNILQQSSCMIFNIPSLPMHFLSVVLDCYSDPSHEDYYLDQSIPTGSRPVVKRVQFKRKKRGARCQGGELTQSLASLLPNQDSWQSHRVKFLGAISCCIMQEGSSLFLQSMNQSKKKKKK